MIVTRIRLLVALARPAVILLLGLFAAVGVAEGGAGNDHVALFKALVVVSGFLLFSVALNDIGDAAIDQVNLPGDSRRPLVTGMTTGRELVVVAAASGAVALAMAGVIGWQALAVVIGGLTLSAAYSLRPVRIADRGAVASLLLPAGYVAVPYLVGLFAVRSGPPTARDLGVLGGLYVGFIGRILLKDFRDVKGDALFGKRTFLVRYGRRTTCAVSAACWLVGLVTLAAVRDVTPVLAAAYIACVGLALALLRRLAANTEGAARRDEFTISAIAIVGRGLLVLLIGHLTTTAVGWAPFASGLFTAAVVAFTVGQAITMARYGPSVRASVPSAWTEAARSPSPAAAAIPKPSPIVTDTIARTNATGPANGT